MVPARHRALAALIATLASGAALAQVTTLEPFNLNASFSIGGNGATRTLESYAGYQDLTLYSTGLSYSSQARSFAPDFSSTTFTILAQRATPDHQPITYSEQLNSYYQNTTRYFTKVLPMVAAPNSGDLTQDLSQDLCSVRVHISQHCGTPGALFFAVNAVSTGSDYGYFNGGADGAADQTQPDKANGFVVVPDPNVSGNSIVTGELLWDKGTLGVINTAYLDINGKSRIRLFPNAQFTTPSPAAGTACIVDLNATVTDAQCLDTTSAEIHGQMSVAMPDAGCDFAPFSGCPTLDDGYPRTIGQQLPDNSNFDTGSSLNRAAVGGVIDYTAPNDITIPAGNYQLIASILHYTWPDGRVNYLQVPYNPGPDLWSPLADLSAVGSNGLPRQPGFYPDGSIWLPPNSTNLANFNGKGAIVTAKVTPRACVALPDLTSSSYYQLGGASSSGANFVTPDGSTRTAVNGLAGTYTYAHSAAAHPGLFEVLGLAGPWTETIFGLNWQRGLDDSAPSNYLNESFNYYLHDNPLTLSAEALTHAPDRVLELGKLNIRMYVQNPAGSATRLRPFQQPLTENSQVIDSSNYYIAQGISSYGPAVMQEEHILHLVVPAGTYVSQFLGGYVPLNPDGTGVLARTQFPNIPNVQILPATAAGQCQAVCVDATTQLSYPDDETPPTFTAQLDTALNGSNQTHTNPVHFSGTAMDLTPIDIVINDQVKQTLPGNGTANTWAATARLATGPNTVTVSAVDKCGEKSSQSFQITITNVPPTLDPVPPQTVYETDTITIQLHGVDGDTPPDPLTYSFLATDLPAGASITFDPALGSFVWHTDYTSEGTYDVHFSVTDGTDTATQVGHLVVLHKNAPPVFDAVADQTIPEKSLLQFSVHATDADTGETLTYAAANLPAGAAFDASTQILSWTPDYGTAPGPYVVHFSCDDGNGATGTLDVTIHVVHTNRPPVPVDVEKTLYETDDVTVALVANDPDVPAYDTLTFSVGQLLPAFTTFSASAPSVRFAPQYGQAGDYHFLVIVSDGHVAVPLHVLVHVLHKNRPPVLDPIPDRTILVDTSTHFVVTGHDPDVGDALTYGLSSEGNDFSFDPTMQLFSFTPDHTQCGLNTFTFIVTDQGGLSASGNANVTVVCPDRPPAVAAVPDATIYELDPLTVVVTATDPDGDSLTYSAVNVPPGASFNPATQTLAWTPGIGQAGSYSVSYVVSDGALSTAVTGKIRVLHRNRPPVFDPPLMQTLLLRQVQENSPLTFTLLATDPDVGDVVRYGLVSGLPAGAVFNPASGVFNWTPAFGTARTQTYDVTFSATDGIATTLGLAHIQVLHTNRPPVWVAASVIDRQGAEGSLLSFAVSATDPDNDALTYSATALPPGAAFDAPTRTFSWTPGPGKAGVYQAAFAVNDGHVSVPAVLALGIAHTNRPPAIDPIPARTVSEGHLITFQVAASDPDGDAVQITASALPGGASFDQALHVFTWVPPYGSASATPYHASFVASDGTLSAATTANITVVHTNRPPSLQVVGELRTQEEHQLILTLVGTDPDSDTLTYSALNLPAGAVFDAAARTVTWTPARGQAGSYQPTFTVSDGALSDSTSPQITVDHVNHPPVLAPIPDQTIAEGSLLTFHCVASDPDGDALQWGTSNLPDGGLFDPAQGFTWTPAVGQAGKYVVTIRVSDGQYTVSRDANITVVDGPHPPIIDPQGPYQIKEGAEVDFHITAHDPANKPITCAATPLPDGAAWDAAGANFSWPTPAGSAGTYRVPVTCSNGQQSAATSVTVIVLPNKLKIEGAGLGCSSTNSAGFLLLVPLAMFLYRRKRKTLVLALLVTAACGKGATNTTAVSTDGTTGALVGRVVVGFELDQSGVDVALQGPSSGVTTTAPDGSYSFAGLAPGSYAVLISAPRTLEGTIALPAQVAAGVVGQVPDQRVTPVGDVAGTVTMGANQLGNGGIVLVARGTTASATAADDGSFVLRDVPAGARQIVATRAGWASATITVTVAWGKMAASPALQLAPASAKGRVFGTVMLAAVANSRGITVQLSGAQAQGAVTAADGSYSFENVPDGTYFVSASANSTREGTLQASAVVVGGGAVQVRTLMLTPLGDLFGIASLGLGQGNAGIAVQVMGSAAAGVAAGDGSWFIRGAPIGLQTVIASLPGYLPASVQNIDVHYAQAVRVPDLTLQRAVPIGGIAGQIVLAGESSHAGVAVHLSGPESSAATTGADGHYSFGSLPDGDYTIVAQAPSTAEGALLANVTVLGGVATAPVLAFTPQGIVAGHAQLGAGGVANQGIAITASGSAALATTGDSTGAFVLSGVPTGSRVINASAPGWFAASAPLTVRYNSIASLAAPLVLQKPLPAGAVFGRALLAGQADQSGIVVTLAGPVSGSVTTGASGDYYFGNVPDGAYAVTASAASTEETSVSGATTVVNGGAAHLVLPDLTPLGAVSGRIVLEGAVAMKAAIAGKSGAAAIPPLSGVLISVPGTNANTTTDENGSFLLAEVPSGQRTVRASLAGWSDASIPLNIPYAQTLVLESSLVLTQAGAGGVLSGLIVLAGVTGQSDAGGVTVTLVGPSNAAATTNAAGAFNFAGLPDGNYAVTASDPCSLEGTATQLAQLINGAQQSPLELNLSPMGGVTGTILNQDGSAARSVPVVLSSGASALSDSMGAYRFDRVPVGSYSLQAAGVVAQVQVNRCQVASADLTIDPLALGTLATVAVAVGSPAGIGISVAATGPTLATGQTAADGTFSLVDLQPGSYSLAFTGPDGAQELLPAVAASAGSNGTVLAAQSFPLAPIELQRGKRVLSVATPAFAGFNAAHDAAAVLLNAWGPPGHIQPAGVPCDALVEFANDQLCIGDLTIVSGDGSVQSIARGAVRPTVRFSPSGRFILYLAGEPVSGTTFLYVKPLQPLAGFSWIPVQTNWTYVSEFQFATRDGAERLLFVGLNPNTLTWDLAEANLETGKLQILARNVLGYGERYVALGTRVIYVDGSKVMRSVGTDLSAPLQLSGPGQDTLTWIPCADPRQPCHNVAVLSPDTGSIAYSSAGVVMTASVSDASKATTLGTAQRMFASPDGSQLLWQTLTGGDTQSIYIAPNQGTTTATSLDDLADAYSLGLSPDLHHALWSRDNRTTFCVSAIDGLAPTCVASGLTAGSFANWATNARISINGNGTATYQLGDAQAVVLAQPPASLLIYAVSPDSALGLATLSTSLRYGAPVISPGGVTPPELLLVELGSGKQWPVMQLTNGLADCQFASDSSGFACRTGGLRVVPGPVKGEGKGIGLNLPLVAFSVSQCKAGPCAPLASSPGAYDYLYVAGPIGSSTLLWLENATAPQGTSNFSGARGTLWAAGPDGSGAAAIGDAVPAPLNQVVNLRVGEGIGQAFFTLGLLPYLPYVPKLSPDGMRLLFASHYSMGSLSTVYAQGSTAQLNELDLGTLESLSRPRALLGGAAVGLWLSGGIAIGLKQRSLPYQIQDGVYLHQLAVGGER